MTAKNLEQRVDDVLSITREKDYSPNTGWERRMKAALAQVFFLGMSVGWDKCVAVMNNKFGDEIARPANHPGETTGDTT